MRNGLVMVRGVHLFLSAMGAAVLLAGCGFVGNPTQTSSPSIVGSEAITISKHNMAAWNVSLVPQPFTISAKLTHPPVVNPTLAILFKSPQQKRFHRSMTLSGAPLVNRPGLLWTVGPATRPLSSFRLGEVKVVVRWSEGNQQHMGDQIFLIKSIYSSGA